MKSVRALLSYAPFLLGIFGCSNAAASAGPTASTRDVPSTRAAQNPLRPAASSAPAAAASTLVVPAQAASAPLEPAQGTLRPSAPASDSNATLSDSALEHELDQLEREIRGS